MGSGSMLNWCLNHLKRSIAKLLPPCFANPQLIVIDAGFLEFVAFYRYERGIDGHLNPVSLLSYLLVNSTVEMDD